MRHANSIPFFRGVFMRDELPRSPKKKECGIINLDNSQSLGSHWVAYAKYNKYIEYFDSYGNLKPPQEFIKYAGTDFNYNYTNIQRDHPYNCGHLCIKFLVDFWKKHEL